jgi:hypothetical protein
MEPKTEKIETTQDLRSKCLDKDVCAILLKGSKNSPSYVKTAMSKLVVEFPKVTFGVVDTSVLYIKNLEEYLPELQNGQPRFVVFQKIAAKDKEKERLKTSIVALATNGVSYGQMSNLVASVVSKTAQLTPIPALPTIKTRTKKLESEEQAKRARKLDQQRRQQDGGSSSQQSTSGGGGHFSGSNDGSAEGRRLEREQRREAHRKNNPDYKEKTPEELKEMERQRRIRMEEEASKWNIAPEDAPEEGEYMENDGDDEEQLDNEDFHNEEEEEDEVLDLD